MEDGVLRAMEKWPDVPAVYGWLKLDRRGRWILRGRPVDLPNTINFINANYHCDDQGRWFFQNGPQRVFVTLESTPLIYHFHYGNLITHTAFRADLLEQILIDEEGMLLLVTNLGLGLLLDSDLEKAVAYFRDSDGRTPDWDRLSRMLDSLHEPTSAALYFHWQGRDIGVEPVYRSSLSQRFGFQKDPQQPGKKD